VYSDIMLLLTLACIGTTEDTAADLPGGLDLFGNEAHSLDGVDFTLMADSSDGLDEPRDLAFHTTADELWVVNRGDDGVTIITAPGTEGQTSVSMRGSAHFLAQPSALAFNDEGDWASIHEEDERTQGPGGTPADFMGPTLWTGNSDIFNGQHESHLDMMHNSPNGMGIAWEEHNTFWVVDGYHGSVTRYAFNGDHDLGGTDHTDGELERWIEGEIGYRADVSSHAVYDHDSALLYVADAGNRRVLALDTTSGTSGGSVGPNYDGASYQAVTGADFTVALEGNAGLDVPSGLAVVDGLIYVTDNTNGNLLAFDLDGELVDWLPTGLPNLQGIAFDADGSLWMVDGDTNEIWRLSL
jgi:hypothetical protein